MITLTCAKRLKGHFAVSVWLSFFRLSLEVLCLFLFMFYCLPQLFPFLFFQLPILVIIYSVFVPDFIYIFSSGINNLNTVFIFSTSSLQRPTEIQFALIQSCHSVRCVYSVVKYVQTEIKNLQSSCNIFCISQTSHVKTSCVKT